LPEIFYYRGFSGKATLLLTEAGLSAVFFENKVARLAGADYLMAYFMV